MTFRFGRKPREFDPRIPHLSASLAGRELPPPPAAVDHTKRADAHMPERLGMMLNDKLENCACAAYYHARQVWTFQTKGTPAIVPDHDVELLYEEACGYKPGEPGGGPGEAVQHVLRYLHEKGAPVGAEGTGRAKIVAFLEVDPRHIDDIKRTIADCGVAYVGIRMPESVIPKDTAPPALWSVDPKNPKIVEGHAVVLPGYDQTGPLVISWGRHYQMTWEFFTKYVDEAYAIADEAWVTAKRGTPGALGLAELEALMKYL